MAGEHTRLRRSMLFVPGNIPSMILAAPYLGADSVILDLEDSVSLSEKDSARRLIVEVLKSLSFGRVERVVRVNSLTSEFGRGDMEAVVGAGADTILLPKATPESLAEATLILDKMGDKSTGLIALIESAYGLEHAYDCAKYSRVSALFLGAEDLTLDIGMERTEEGSEIYYARCRIVTAASAAGVQSIDTPFTNVLDDEAFSRDLKTTRRLGFSGRACIHPLQVEIVHKALAPGAAEVEWAQRVISADMDAQKRGLGAVTLDGRMIDLPIVTRAKSVLRRAFAAGVIQDEETLHKEGKNHGG